MLPVVNINGYQGMSTARSSGDTATNLQGTVNLTHVRGAHTLRVGHRCAAGPAAAWAWRQPVRAAHVHQRVHAPGQRHVAAHAKQPRALSLAAFMLGIPSTRGHDSADERPPNNFYAAFVQDTWRLRRISRELGLRFEWENGISRRRRRDVRRLRPGRDRWPSTELAEAAYRQGADRAGAGVAVPASAAGRSTPIDRARMARAGSPQAMWMPRFSAAYKLGDKTVLKAGYGMYYDTLNANEYTANNARLQLDDDQHQQHRLRADVPLGIYAGRSDVRSLPARSNGTRSTSRPGRRSV